MNNQDTYTRKHITDLIEVIAQEFDNEWNGDSDTAEESFILNECADSIRGFKKYYE